MPNEDCWSTIVEIKKKKHNWDGIELLWSKFKNGGHNNRIQMFLGTTVTHGTQALHFHCSDILFEHFICFYSIVRDGTLFCSRVGLLHICSCCCVTYNILVPLPHPDRHGVLSIIFSSLSSLYYPIYCSLSSNETGVKSLCTLTRSQLVSPNSPMDSIQTFAILYVDFLFMI
jgi:hypothetical protein